MLYDLVRQSSGDLVMPAHSRSKYVLLPPAYVAGIHALGRRAPNQRRDGRNKSGHDDVDASFLPGLRGRGGVCGCNACASGDAYPSRVASAYALRARASADGSLATPPRAPAVRDPPPAREGEVRALRRRPFLQRINPLLRLSLAGRALLRVELGDEIVEREIGLAARL